MVRRVAAQLAEQEAHLLGWWRKSPFTEMLARRMAAQLAYRDGGGKANLPGWWRQSLLSRMMARRAAAQLTYRDGGGKAYLPGMIAAKLKLTYRDGGEEGGSTSNLTGRGQKSLFTGMMAAKLKLTYRDGGKEGGGKAHDHHLVLQVPVVVQQVGQVKEVHPRRP